MENNSVATETKEIRSESFGVRLTPTEVKQLKELADMEERSSSDMLRLCFIREYRLRLPQPHHRRTET